MPDPRDHILGFLIRQAINDVGSQREVMAGIKASAFWATRNQGKDVAKSAAAEAVALAKELALPVSKREPGLPLATSAGQGEPHQFDPEPAPNESRKEWLARLLREGCDPVTWDRLWREHTARA
jgi:hypothetical protein